MRKVHIVSVDDPLLLDLALAIKDKGYEVSVSDLEISVDTEEKLRKAGCIFYGNGWFPEKLTKDFEFVVFAPNIKKDNPELLKAKELKLLITSIPEFVYYRTQSKTRVVIAGSRGKKTILTFIAEALNKKRISFDYAMADRIPLLPGHFHMSYEARIALIEGDAHIMSNLEKKYRMEFYRPHIALISSLDWSKDTRHESADDFMHTYSEFITSIEREGKLFFYSKESELAALASQSREDVTAIPYEDHPTEERDGQLYLTTRYGDFPVKITHPEMLQYINAARLICRQLGVKDADFYQIISDYTLSL